MGSTTTESSFSFDPPPSPRSARSAEKSTTHFSFDPLASNEPHVSHKSFKTRANAENKENVRTADIGRVAKHANKAENGTGKKERRSFKCERLSNIFSIKDSSSAKEKHSDTSAKLARRISSAPVYRKNSSISQSSKFDNDDESSSTGTSSDLTMFPFDREAIDYERIQRECFAVEEEYDNDAFVARKAIPYDYDTEDSPSYEMLDQKIPADGIFQQYAIISQQEKDRQKKKRGGQSPAEMKALSKLDHINKKLNETSALIHDQPTSAVTSPIPDLKIDFFAESTLTASAFSRENEKEKSNALDGSQKDATSSFSSKSNNNTNSSKSATNGSINLTSNPMSTAVVTTPRATIVVQQVCLDFVSLSP